MQRKLVGQTYISLWLFVTWKERLWMICSSERERQKNRTGCIGFDITLVTEEILHSVLHYGESITGERQVCEYSGVVVAYRGIPLPVRLPVSEKHQTVARGTKDPHGNLALECTVIDCVQPQNVSRETLKDTARGELQPKQDYDRIFFLNLILNNSSFSIICIFQQPNAQLEMKYI